MVASELLEAGRAMQNGYVSPERTTLIASTHRIYATVEKMQMADGRFDSERVLEARQAAREARGAVRHAQARAGKRHGDQRGAVRRHGRQRRAAAAARSLRGRRSGAAASGAEASLRGFAAGYDIAAGARADAGARLRTACAPDGAEGDPQPGRRPAAATTRAKAYAALYRERMCRSLGDADAKLAAEVGAPPRALDELRGHHPRGRPEDARLALRASAQGSRREAKASRSSSSTTLQPGIEESCLAAAARPRPYGPIAWAERRGKLDAYNVGMHVKTSGHRPATCSCARVARC